MLREPRFLGTGITLNIMSEDKHDPYFEHFNRTLNERCCICFATLRFKRIPRRMVVELVYGYVFWYNFVILEDYMSNTMGPATIVTGQTYNCNKLCGSGAKYGNYVQTHERTDNSMGLFFTPP